ncbi:hypothetical protein ACJX0J_009965 [Zea mays]
MLDHTSKRTSHLDLIFHTSISEDLNLRWLLDNEEEEKDVSKSGQRQALKCLYMNDVKFYVVSYNVYVYIGRQRFRDCCQLGGGGGGGSVGFEGAKIGDTIISGTKVPISMGNALPFSARYGNMEKTKLAELKVYSGVKRAGTK